MLDIGLITVLSLSSATWGVDSLRPPAREEESAISGPLQRSPVIQAAEGYDN